jgi:hypothetical protein
MVNYHVALLDGLWKASVLSAYAASEKTEERPRLFRSVYFPA